MVWREIISGERLARTKTLERDIQLIMNRAQEARLTIETAIGIIPGPSRLIRFIAGSITVIFRSFSMAFVDGPKRVQ